MTTSKMTARILVLFTVLFALVVALVGLTASTSAQSGQDNIPTPTPQAVWDVSYTLTQVGGTEATFTMPAFEQGGISIGETTVISLYPLGMSFTASLTSINGPISDATLSIESPSGSRDRAIATFDDELQTWTAQLWTEGGQPAWSHFTAQWNVVDSSGLSIESTPFTVDYTDPTRQWWRVESDHIIIYWYAGLLGEPEEIADGIVNSMAATQLRRTIGFGGPLSYKPIGVIYANVDDFGEIYPNETEAGNWSTFSNSDMGMAVQILAPYSPNCAILDPREEYPADSLTLQVILHDIPSTIAYLYQYDKGVAVGPEWWRTGQMEWFSPAPDNYDLRLRNLAQLDNALPSLEGDTISSSNLATDGCHRLGHDVGASFINWLLANYGGLQKHAEIIELLRAQKSLYEAIAEVTGKSFLEIENEWRAYIGFNILE